LNTEILKHIYQPGKLGQEFFAFSFFFGLRRTNTIEPGFNGFMTSRRKPANAFTLDCF
jgi:hypothetical protein